MPVALIVVVPNVLVVGPNVPANSVRDLIALIKAKPEAFSYGSSGVGSTQHLAGEAFNLAAGTKAAHVPYKGSAQALADLVGGQIQHRTAYDIAGRGLANVGAMRNAFALACRMAATKAVETAAEKAAG